MGNFINYQDPSPWPWIIEQDGNEVMWLENPKCGSSSMKHFMLKDKSRFKITQLKKKSLSEKKVKNIKTIKESPRFSKIFKFGICRDPYHRIVSCYRMIKESPIKGGGHSVENVTFEGFVDKVVKEEWKNHHWAPQYWFLPTEKINFDMIFKLETLCDNFSIVFDKLNVNDKELEVVRPVSEKVEYDVGSYLTNKETLDKIRDYYYNDFELYHNDAPVLSRYCKQLCVKCASIPVNDTVYSIMSTDK